MTRNTPSEPLRLGNTMIFSYTYCNTTQVLNLWEWETDWTCVWVWMSGLSAWCTVVILANYWEDELEHVTDWWRRTRRWNISAKICAEMSKKVWVFDNEDMSLQVRSYWLVGNCTQHIPLSICNHHGGVWGRVSTYGQKHYFQNLFSPSHLIYVDGECISISSTAIAAW